MGGGTHRGGFTDGFSGVFGSRGWLSRWLAFTGLLLVPVAGPLACFGWSLARTRTSSTGDAEVPPLEPGPMLRDAVRALPGSLGWAAAGSLTFGLASLLEPAFRANYARFGTVGSYFGFREAATSLRREPLAYLRALIFPVALTLPLALLSGAGWLAAGLLGGTGKAAVMAALGAVALLGLLAAFPLVMASARWLGLYAAAAYGPAGTSPQLTPLTVAAGIVTEDAPDLVPPEGFRVTATPAAPFVLEEAPAPAAVLPRNAAAVFTPAAGALNPALPGTPVLYADGEFRLEALGGRVVPLGSLAEMDGRGLLSWPRAEVRAAVLRKAGRA